MTDSTARTPSVSRPATDSGRRGRADGSGGAEVDVPVLIVGGGCSGLTASMLLTQLGVETLLVNAAPQTSTLPKAHLLNQRTMEILRDLGVADEVYERGTPAEQMSHVGWYAGLDGEHEDYGRECAKIEAWGAGGANPAWAAASPCRVTNLPQLRLEPILLRRARELAPDRILLGHEVTAFEQDADGVTATVLDKSAGSSFQVRARYLLGCDGGRMVGPSLGVDMQGAPDIARMVSIHFSADLSHRLGDPEVLVRWLWLPRTGLGVSLIPMGPTRWGPDSEEWVVHLSDAADSSGDDAVVAELCASLGLSGEQLRIHRVTRWQLEGVVAERFREGRVFLLGDAAHRHPPTGGFGLNSAVQDAHNLAWKIAAILDDKAGEALLDSYEDERKRIAIRNVQHSVNSAVNHLLAIDAMGMGPGSEPEGNWKALRRLWCRDEEDSGFRTAVRRAIASQSMEFDALGLEYGYTYGISSAVVGEDTPEPDNPDPVRIYRPGTRPGQPLPHAWLDSADGKRIPLMDLVAPGRFLLITGEDDKVWTAAAEEVSGLLRVPLDTVRIGHLDGDCLDPRSAWTAHRDIGPEGAVLVRPDRFVAWRSADSSDAPVTDLAGALEQVLALSQ